VLETFASRVELWNRAIAMLGDYSFTGIGLGQFNTVLHTLYMPLLVSPYEQVPHAHNLLLEYALELGVPGAVAVGAVVVAFFRSCFAAAKTCDPQVRWLGIGLALGMTAFFIFGTVDAIAPGARAGIVFWFVIGLGVSVGNFAIS